MPPQSLPPSIPLNRATVSPTDQNVGLQVGWTVVYRDANDRLQDGRILEILDPSAKGSVNLDSGVTIPIAKITAVKAVDQAGRCLGAWTVNPHGYDGTRSATLPVLTGPDRWLKRFRRLAELTAGITSNDPRFPSSMRLLDQCEEAYVQGHDDAFIQCARQVTALVNAPVSRQTASTESGERAPSQRAAQRPSQSSDHSPT
ncbi:hypothetical protein DNFV4_02031 [Nitrospira tepida]|uniref:Uncharacterized protein n=1 Tax=Nitrospira tepida TaxID=2973512 RepID=A0AA86MYX0_9BACT|nr:hypothetical protein [Nitrospira tepida]CAI4031612.1 hypothetical protein DNFV4_02031 [Nitrospira tepida]